MVARSSRFVSRLPFLEGMTIGVCETMRDLGLSPVRRDCSPNRSRHNPPCGSAVGGHIDGYNSEGKVDEPGTRVGKDVDKSEDNCGVKQGAVKDE